MFDNLLQEPLRVSR